MFIKKTITIIKNGKSVTRDMTPQEEKEFDNSFKEMDKSFKQMDEAFKEMDKGFKTMNEMFGRIK